MTQETVLDANKGPSNEFSRYNANEDSVLVKTARLTINLVTNMLMVLIVFVCLLYACSLSTLNVFQLHIVLCVLGYQFCMSQGTLIISKYNSWSMFLPRRHRRHLHILLQLIGIILVTVGSIIVMDEKYVNFDTTHGFTGLLALITSLISLINGVLAVYAYKLSSFIDSYWIKLIHYATGIGTLLLSAVCLCLGFDKVAFKSWSGSEHAILLMTFTCVFTVFVAIEFSIATGKRICSSLLLSK